MKKCFFLLLAAGISLGKAFAQATEGDEAQQRSVVEKPSRDFLMLKFNYSGWTNLPDSIKTKGFGRGFAASLSYDFPIKKSHFSFAAGLGLNVSNIYLDKQLVDFKDTASAAQILFRPDNNNQYKKYKFTTAYLEMPLELRFFGNNKNRNRGFKAALGANVGLNLGSHTKGTTSGGSSKINEKQGTRRFMQQWSFAPTARIGYGNLSLYGSYNLTPLFKDGSGPEILPFSIGICITGL